MIHPRGLPIQRYMSYTQIVCHEWTLRYSELSKWLGFELQKDVKATSLADLVASQYSFPKFEKVIVVGPLAQKVKMDGTLMAVDGSIRLLERTPEILVTDLDGASETDVERVLKNGGWVFLHIHGDNYEKAIEVYINYKSGRVVPTVQLLAQKAFCIPALTDGDRALILARLISRYHEVIGFGKEVDIERVKKNVIYPKKRMKMELSRTYEVITWERYSGGLPVQDIG